ncbi:HPr family phosphocarrier protein [Paenibacillus doosanensis]|uniref:Phosphocarrier protein HPr n=1 Tax=Paenibacillus konkukensis TaxID=2020716 RepID=A0ABY4RXJ1_9BACL|nr:MULTISPECIES: HPr family phosphocarrier protein [Paenibacillus]MCS7458610.1 HPr family phosphocarrier protein [Paenibacillus doosanensis]UQZ86867.1 Phosphocarrier protein HPr [Paenibacillus konkukensis]
MLSQSFTVMNPSGFHARPTKIFVQQASEFPCKINLTKNGKKVNGKSSLSMLTLGLAQNDEVLLEVDGEQEEQAMEALGALLTKIYEE